jgi:CDP-diacylglycerol---glycerol-3-phosphate 3-phosphatidyltransferase
VNLPNAVTIGRLLLAPAAVILVATDSNGSVVAAVLFVLLAASDSLDGYLARSRDSVTRFGTIMDPLADKLLVVPTLFALALLDRLWIWVAFVVLARELAVSALRYVAGRGGTIIPASPFGKVKMLGQVVTIVVLLAVPDPAVAWVQALVIGMAGITVLSGIDYFLRFRQGQRAAVRAKLRRDSLEATPQRAR